MPCCFITLLTITTIGKVWYLLSCIPFTHLSTHSMQCFRWGLLNCFICCHLLFSTTMVLFAYQLNVCVLCCCLSLFCVRLLLLSASSCDTLHHVHASALF